jgi:hypothetical protein
MLRTFLCAAIALTLCLGLTRAEEKKKKGTTAAGTIKKVDADKGVITVTVKKKKDQTEDKDFKVEEATKFVIFVGEDKKEASGKDGLKNENVKEGAKIAVVSDEDGKVTQIRIGTPPKKTK